jgi:uncharacterized protein YjdB
VALAVSVVNANGQRDTTTSVKWVSTNPAVATVSDSGMVTLVATGATQISATAGGVSASAQANVSSAPAPVARVRVSPSTVSLTPGQYTPLSAVPLDASGNQLTGQVVTWLSSNTSVATVSTSGIVTAVAVGAAVITASAGGINGTANVTVAAASPAAVASVTITPATTSLTVGGTAQLTATDKDASGNVLAGRAVTWTTSSSSIVWVDGNGELTANGAGSATITATSGGKTGTATVTVTQAAVASVTVTPVTTSLTVGGTGQLTATDKDANGTVLTGRAVSWTTSNSSIVWVNGNGQLTANGAGTATITATSGGQTGTATVSVSQVAVASVAVTPGTASLTPGQTVQLTATAYDANGNALTGRAVTWSSSPAAVATVSGTGLATAVAVGTAKLTATIGGQSGSSSITVGQPVVAAVAVSPTSASINVGGTTQLTPTATTASGATVSGVTYSWSSANSGMASVSSTGLVTGVAAGSTTITVTSNGKSATASIAVTGTTTPPPSGGGAQDEPAGLTAITQRPFSALQEDGWGSIYNASGGGATITQDATAPKSPVNVMQVTYPVGLVGGYTPMSQEYAFSGGQTQFYGVIWIKMSSNFVGNGAGVNKVFYMWTDDQGGGPTWYLSAQAAGSANFSPEVRTQGTAPAEDYGPNVAGQTGYTFPRNTWVQWEWYITNNTPGNSDGIVRMWMNGVKVAEYDNVQVSTSGSQTHFTELQFAPYWGGGGGTISANQYLWIDHLYASGQ